jgi:hypothetical protein
MPGSAFAYWVVSMVTAALDAGYSGETTADSTRCGSRVTDCLGRSAELMERLDRAVQLLDGVRRPAGQARMKRWMAWLALSWNEAFRRSGKVSAWSTTGPVMVLAALA